LLDKLPSGKLPAGRDAQRGKLDSMGVRTEIRNGAEKVNEIADEMPQRLDRFDTYAQIATIALVTMALVVMATCAIVVLKERHE